MQDESGSKVAPAKKEAWEDAIDEDFQANQEHE